MSGLPDEAGAAAVFDEGEPTGLKGAFTGDEATVRFCGDDGAVAVEAVLEAAGGLNATNVGFFAAAFGDGFGAAE